MKLPALSRAVILTANDPVPIETLHLESGTVEIEGTADPIEEFGTVTSPYGATECLAYKCECKEQKR